MLASGSKILHLAVRVNKAAEPDELEEIIAYGKSLPPEKQEHFTKSLELIQSTIGQVADFILTFVHTGILYNYEAEAAWFEDYWSIWPGPIENESEEIEDEQEKATKEAELEQWLFEEARKLLSFKGYLSAGTLSDRRSVAVQRLLKGSTEQRSNMYEIARAAEKLFQAEVQPTIDQQIVDKIKKMIAENPKLTKTAAAGILGMTDREINRYWHRRNER